jgi:translocation and assembly module TamB
VRRAVKLPLFALAAAAALAVVAAVAGLIVIQTSWFREQVRQRIVREAGSATGGRVDLSSFAFDWRRLTATVRDLTIHGTEASSEAPLFRAESVEVGLKIVSIWKKKVDLESLTVVRPRVNVIVYEDGRTNLPTPAAARHARKGALETVLDLAVRRFRVVDGTVQAAARRSRVDALGEDLEARFVYDAGPPRYRGGVSFRKLNVTPGARPAMPFDLDAEVTVEADRVEIVRARLGLKGSWVEARGNIENPASPRVALNYRARIEMRDVAPDLGVPQIPGRGEVSLEGAAAYTRESGTIATAKMTGAGLAFEERGVRIRNIGLASNVEAKPDGVSFRGLVVTALGGQFTGRAELIPWTRFSAEGDVRDYSLDELTRFEGVRRTAWNGTLSGPVAVTGAIDRGKVRDLVARAHLTIAPAASGNPVDGVVDLIYRQRNAEVEFAPSYLNAGDSRAEFVGVLGRRIEVKLESRNLDDFEPAIGMFSAGPPPALPVKLASRGAAEFAGAVVGPLASPTVQGRGRMTRFVYDGHLVDRAQADVVVSSAGVSSRNATVVKEKIEAVGWVEVGLSGWRAAPGQPVAGAFRAQTADVGAVLSELGANLPVRGGPASANVTLEGTVGAIEVGGDAQAKKLVAWGQPLDAVSGRVRYAPGFLEIAGGQIHEGASRAAISASYAHRPGAWREGTLRFQAATDGVDLSRVREVTSRAPGLGGRLTAKLSGEIALAPGGFRPGAIDGWVNLDNLAAEGERLGAVHATAAAKGAAIEVGMEGELAGSRLHGAAQWSLQGDYPFHGEMKFAALRFSEVLAHFGKTAGRAPSYEGLVTGQVRFSGRSVDSRSWKAEVTLPTVEIRPSVSLVTAAQAGGLTLRNEGPVTLDVTAQGAKVRQAQFRGNNSDLSATGGVGFGGKNPWDLRVRGNLNLALLQEIEPRVASSAGSVSLDVSVRGALARPDVYGRIDLKNASLNWAGFPNGIENANGLIFLYRDRATIENLTGESGGGKVTVSGFFGFGEGDSFHLQARARAVRMRYPEGVSSTANANLSFTGTPERSLISGEVTVTRVGFNPRSDLGSILARTTGPVRTTVRAGRFERGVQLDVHIITSPQLRVETSLTRDVQADADLRLRGDLVRPVLLGRVLVNQGEVMFFGNRYSIGSGQILFVNAARIEPVVNLDLETKARGVAITLHISGPMDKLNVSYRSDPPLSFPDIVALLATGQAPTSTAGAGSAQTGATAGLGNAGASALLSQAIANPIAGRLQRFFGVSRLKINPLVAENTTNNAAARVTLEQQITQDLTFTYITDLSRAQAQTIQVEWNFSRFWSAIAVREENGLFAIDFQYRKQFK